MGITFSTLFRRRTISSTNHAEQGYDSSSDAQGLRPSSRGSSLGPTPSLMYGPACSERVSPPANNTRDRRASGPPLTDLSHDELYTSVHVPALCSQSARDCLVDPSAIRIQELQGSAEGGPLRSYMVEDDEGFGEFIVAFPPRNLHLYPRMVEAIPNERDTTGGSLHVETLVSRFGHECERLEFDLDVRADAMQDLTSQIWATRCLLGELSEMRQCWDGEASHAAELERSILDAANELSDLRIKLAVMRKALERTIADNLAIT